MRKKHEAEGAGDGGFGDDVLRVGEIHGGESRLLVRHRGVRAGACQRRTRAEEETKSRRPCLLWSPPVQIWPSPPRLRQQAMVGGEGGVH